MSQFAFGHDRRLRCAHDYKQVFDHTVFKIHQPGFLFLAIPCADRQACRLGLVVAKKKIRRAHERNRVKRLTRESFRLHQHQLIGLDIVVLPKAGIERIENADLQQQLQSAWLKLIRLFVKQQHNTVKLPYES